MISALDLGHVIAPQIRSEILWREDQAAALRSDFPFPEVFAPLAVASRYKATYGGRGSGKSRFFADLLISRADREPGLRAVCIREVQKSLEQSVKRVLEDRISERGLSSRFRVLKACIVTPGNGIIIFSGMQAYNADNIKSLEGYDLAWVEEAQSFSQRSLDLLRPTIRREGSELWFSWNPREPDDPVDVFFRSNPPSDAAIVRANYTDNPWLPEVLRQEMQWDRDRDPSKYANIWLGEYEQRSEARVFKNWRVEEFETPARPDPEFLYGADWGFSQDPTVLVRCWKQERTLFIDREAYAIGCEIDDTPALFDTLDGGAARRWVCVADSARPETISHMKKHGYPKMEPSIKGAKSVEEGVAFLQSLDIVVHPRCRHTIDELTAYKYKTDALTGNVLPVLVDANNHCIDALRYAVEKTRRAQTGGGLAWPCHDRNGKRIR